MAFIVSSFDDDLVGANARVWDFVMPPKSCSTLPLSSECLIYEIFQAQAGKTNQPANGTNGRVKESPMTMN